MTRSLVLAGFLASASMTCAARADGLIYQLPEDGTSATFDMVVTQTMNGKVDTINGTLSISSVGRKLVDGERCRWIECKMAFKFGAFDQVVITKALIPDSHLGKGKSPHEHVIRRWYKTGSHDAVAVEDQGNTAVAIPFLAGPAKDTKEIQAVEVDSKLGKLECVGAIGSLEFKNGNETTIAFTFENRLNEKAPFGVLASTWTSAIRKNGRVQSTCVTRLTLANLASNAVSELPDNN